MNDIPIETIMRENIKSLRKQLGWSQEFLAKKTGVSAPYITQIEVGKRTPSLDIVAKITSALGVEYKTLFEAQERTTCPIPYDFSLYLLESKLISVVTAAIQKEFKNENNHFQID